VVSAAVPIKAISTSSATTRIRIDPRCLRDRGRTFATIRIGQGILNSLVKLCQLTDELSLLSTRENDVGHEIFNGKSGKLITAARRHIRRSVRRRWAAVPADRRALP